MDTKAVLNHFYEGFATGNATQMTSCYHPNIIFSDPAFGTLEGEAAKAMWQMLLKRGKGMIAITFDHIKATEAIGSARWTAKYPYGPKKRPVINHVSSKFIFKEGKIIQHHDTFDLYNFSKQALGITGYLLGWTDFMQSKIQKKAKASLNTYILKKQ